MMTTASTRYHTDRFTLVRDKPEIYENLHRSWQSGGTFTARRTFTGGAVAFAADAMHYQLGSSRLGDRRELRRGGASQITWGDGAGSTFDLGARADNSTGYGGFLSPSVAFSAPISEFVRFRASGSRGFRAPTWTERFYTDPANRGNADLVPERFWSGEAGLRVIEDANSFDVVYFLRRAENLIDWVKPAAAVTALANSAADSKPYLAGNPARSLAIDCSRRASFALAAANALYLFVVMGGARCSRALVIASGISTPATTHPWSFVLRSP